MYDVVSIGSTTVDAFWSTDFKTIESMEYYSGKVLLVPLGEKFITNNLNLSLGGNAANSSITFARNNLKTSLFTKIGEDIKGKQVIKWLKTENVYTKNIEISKNAPTSESIILVQSGSRSIITYHGAINEFSLSDVILNKIKAKWWYISLPGDSYKLFDRLLDYAEKNNIKIALNPSGIHLSKGKEDLHNHMTRISVFIVNEGEAASFMDASFKDEDKTISKLSKLTSGIVIVTKGRKGVIVNDGKYVYKSGIFKDRGVKDRTGAGDAFGSGFVAGLLKKNEYCKKGVCDVDNIKYALRLASANSTSVVEHIGSTGGILTYGDFTNDKRWENLDIEIKSINN